MKLAILVITILVFILGCSTDSQSEPIVNTLISGTHELLLTEQDLEQLGMASDTHNEELQQLGMLPNGTACKTEEYETSEYSPLAQYSICSYRIDGLNDTEVIVEWKKFTNVADLNGTYQYESSHLYGGKGLLDENGFGDQSRFRVNNEDDYGAEYNEPNICYYHLYFSKDTFLVHITSKGSKDAQEYIANIARGILKKFE